jgi:hypothetical protein
MSVSRLAHRTGVVARVTDTCALSLLMKVLTVYRVLGERVKRALQKGL